MNVEKTTNLNNRFKPHKSVTTMMLVVLVTLVPGVASYLYFFGLGMILNIIVACITALAAEALILWWRKKPVVFYLKDCSALVTAVLLALCLPSLAPWWLTAIATLFAIVIAKHLYGGLGHNIFNPAMIGYVVIIISFPQIMSTQWLNPEATKAIDSYTAATPLDNIKTELDRGQTISEVTEASPTLLFGEFGAYSWDWVNLAFLLGGIALLYLRIIRWHIPLMMLGTIFLIAAVFHYYDSDNYLPPLFHLFSGGTILAAFYIATDPVTSPNTQLGHIYFGIGIGIYTYVIRTWGGYPDGIAFAVLLMNMKTPLLDYVTQPRAFGHPKKRHTHITHKKDSQE